ncbi:hypothetical protein [Bacillus sp. FJAT-26390]|uniref:hypothetical protein n=1 Tax=Bacillus sp. FJAT-26390 TaxID=1743142 RepID=UPI000807FCDC|nr:hypothetical protein [Bacillus sp. FJAT-26390]OBZ17097.1 hypothetical protein A7975_04205 [Bacillus sp. FJAT-26390]
MFLYNRHRITKILNTIPVIQSLLSVRAGENFICPYDKLIIGAVVLPQQPFIDLVRPASFHADDDDSFYQNKLIHDLFSVQWSPMNSLAPATSIMLNPWKHRLTPDAVLALVDLVLGNHYDAYIVKSDDKVDCLQFITSEELSKRLYVGYQKKPPQDYRNLGQTFLYGKRGWQQVKNYDKAEEQGLADVTWTRIERTRRQKDKHTRKTLLQFLFDERADAMKHMIVVDTDKFRGRDKIIRRIKKYGTFQEAFMSLDANKKRRLRVHEAFRRPIIDLGSTFRSDLDKWMAHSPKLYFMFRNYVVLKASWSGKDNISFREVRVNPINLHHTWIPAEQHVGKERYRLRQSYFTDV